MSADQVGRMARQLGRWSEALAFEEAQVGRREARTGCPLSARQVEVLGVFASGEVAQAKQVGRRLGMTEKTVTNHVAACARALGTSGTLQTVIVAVLNGWVRLPVLESPAA